MVRSLLSFSSPSADKGMTSVSLQCQTLDLSSITERKKKKFCAIPQSMFELLQNVDLHF